MLVESALANVTIPTVDNCRLSPVCCTATEAFPQYCRRKKLLDQQAFIILYWYYY